MYQIDFANGIAEQPVCVADRLRRMLEITTKLQKAGWRMWFALGGVAFALPTDECLEEDELDARLKELGITEEVKRIEQEHGEEDFTAMDDFDWDMTDSPLRWALGDEGDILGT